MKIIKHGNTKDLKYRAHCPNCGCIVELSHYEYTGKLLPEYAPGTLNMIGQNFWMPCPECGTLMECAGDASKFFKPPRDMRKNNG